MVCKHQKKVLSARGVPHISNFVLKTHQYIVTSYRPETSYHEIDCAFPTTYMFSKLSPSQHHGKMEHRLQRGDQVVVLVILHALFGIENLGLALRCVYEASSTYRRVSFVEHGPCVHLLQRQGRLPLCEKINHLLSFLPAWISLDRHLFGSMVTYPQSHQK